MSKDNLPNKRTTANELSRFLQQSQQLPRRLDNSVIHGGRLIFAMDATASRQPSWDRACHIQARMFSATDRLGGIQLQLCHYRGINEFYSSNWLNNSQALLNTMSQVSCAGGYTQLGRVLDHCLAEHARQPVQAAIIIGDAVEENINSLCVKAGKLGMLGVPLFMFQEGSDHNVSNHFQQMAQLSHGAYAHFDENSADHLANLLAAVATYTSGGVEALQRLSNSAAHHLLQQLSNRGN